MRLSTRLWKLTKDIVEVGATIVGDVVEGWALNDSRQSILNRLQESAERGAELALENARLRDQVDELRFNGPTLWKDEVEVLNLARRAPGSSGYSKTIGRLLDRCDHMPMTADELDAQVKGIMDGTAKLLPWDAVFPNDDPGVDIDLPVRTAWSGTHWPSCTCHECMGEGPNE